MILSKYLKQVERFTADNSPAILTAIGIVGVVSTAYLTGKASVRAVKLIQEEEAYRVMYNKPPATQRDLVELVWKEYIPAIGSSVATIACIICSNRIGSRRTAAIAAAYSISEKAFAQYEEKVIERLGEKKHREIHDEIAEDNVRNTRPTSEVMVIGDGNVLCFDSFSGRYFQSSMETIKKAQNDTNYQILNGMYASLGDFYSRLGLAGTSYSEEVGWNSDHLLEVMFSTVLSDDGRPCLAINFNVKPVRHYHKFG